MRSIKILRGSALTLALFIAMAAMAYSAHGAANEIQGTIKDALGRPLSGASLVLKAPDETVKGRTKSDANGHFVFSNVKPGAYAVLAEKSGFQTGSVIVTLEAGTIATATLTLAAKEALEVAVEAERLNQARNSLSPKTGGSTYNFDQTAIDTLPEGENTSFNQVLLQAPGVANDSFGALHVRGDHANIQYRIDGVILPEGITGFGQDFDTRFVSNIDLLTGALPAQFGLREAGVVDITTKSVYETGGSVEMYGGSRDTVQPSFQVGGTDGKLNYFATGSYLQNSIGIENPVRGANPIHDDSEQLKGFAYASYLLDPTSRVFTMFGSYDGWFQIPNNPGATPNEQFLHQLGISGFDPVNLNERQYETNRFWVLGYQGAIGSDFDYQVSYVSRYTSVHFTPDPIGDLVFNGVATDVFDSSFVNGLQGDGSYRLNDCHTIRMGFYASDESTMSNNVSTVFPEVNGTVSGGPFTIIDDEPKKGNTLSSAYVQDEWKPFDKWTVNYGLRFDYYSAYVTSDQLSPRLGVVYKITPDTTLHAGYARYFTPPPTELITQRTVSLYDNTSNAAAVPENPPVQAERSHYFDVGVIQKITPALTVGVDGFYKHSSELIDEGQFGQALIFAPFNYAHGEIEGVETTVNYKAGNFGAYGNLAVTQSLAKEVTSGQYNFSEAELEYIANNWIHTDHDQLFTASAGVSYRWWEALFTVDATYGSGLRAGFANTQSVPYSLQINPGVKRKFMLGKCPVEARVVVLNVLDRANEIRSGTGIGVFAPQYGPRIGLFSGLKYIF